MTVTTTTGAQISIMARSTCHAYAVVDKQSRDGGHDSSSVRAVRISLRPPHSAHCARRHHSSRAGCQARGQGVNYRPRLRIRMYSRSNDRIPNSMANITTTCSRTSIAEATEYRSATN